MKNHKLEPDLGTVLESISLQKKVCEWENLITENLEQLAKALTIAANNRLMSLEHAKIIWKSYLTVSGMDVPKELNEKVKSILEKEEE